MVAVALLACAGSSVAALAVPVPDQSKHFNSAGFIIRHAWVKFAYLGGRPFRASLTDEEEQAKVARFFELNGLIASKEQEAGDPAMPRDIAAAALDQSAALRDERRGLKNTVQAILAGRLTAVVKEAGLTRHVRAEVVWPPVDIEFADPPAVLVTSPRDAIRKDGESLLQGDLPIERVQDIEQDAESDGNTSALVVDISGIAMYPAIIPESDDYRGTLQDIAHEWTHHYLFFAPLGRRYFENGKLTTLNETLADHVGREMGDMMFERWPLDRSEPPMTAPAPPAPRIDFTKEMRDLRRQVEALLSDDKVDEAEALMEEKRRFLADNGYYIRRLNQAYFAFHGSYADSAGSIDPIGPKFDELREKSGSLRDFVRTAQQFTSEQDLDRALVEPARASAP